jgi:hypothetical protein
VSDYYDIVAPEIITVEQDDLGGLKMDAVDLAVEASSVVQRRSPQQVWVP